MLFNWFFILWFNGFNLSNYHEKAIAQRIVTTKFIAHLHLKERSLDRNETNCRNVRAVITIVEGSLFCGNQSTQLALKKRYVFSSEPRKILPTVER